MLASLERTLLSLPRSALLYRFYNSSSRRSKTNRSYPVQTVKPVNVQNQKWTPRDREEEETEVALEEFRKEFPQEVEKYGDVIDEPNLSGLTNTYDTYMKETRQGKDIIKRQRLTKKHYKDFIPRGISLLTYAEKENIRYLMETEPDQWTPETISQAYPISPENVVKVAKSKMRLNRAKDVKSHDEAVAFKIQQIKSGKIPMTEELAERIKIRDLIPVKVGDLGINPDQFVDVKPRVTGEFARLVTPPSLLKEKSIATFSNNTPAKYITDGSYYKDESEFQNELKQELSEDELKKIIRKKTMTFTEFESKIKNSNASKLAADMKYMLDLNNVNKSSPEQNDTHPNATSDIFEKSAGNHDSDFDSSYNSPTQKYKSPEEAGVVTLNVEGGEKYIYQADTGYQKPFESPSIHIQERITIPDKLRRPGSTYKLGDCYYNEDGEFLYRVL